MSAARLVMLGATGAVAIVLTLLGLAMGGIVSVGAAAPPPAASAPGGAPVDPNPTSGPDVAQGAARYEVTGDGPAVRIDYATVADASDEVNMPLPWRKSSGAPWMSLSASRGEGPGSITCRITGFGRVLAEDTADGPYAVCTTSQFVEEATG